MLQRRGIYERLIVQITFVSESLSIVLCSSTSSLVASHEKNFAQEIDIVQEEEDQ